MKGKTKLLKIAAFCTAVLLVAGLGIFANGFIGNPVSEWMAKKAAEEYLAAYYADSDYEIDRVSYSFKDGYYYAYVFSKSSSDSSFSVRMTMAGKVAGDDYEFRVEGRGNTADRLCSEYRDAVDRVIGSSAYPYQVSIGFGDLEFQKEVGRVLPEGFVKQTDLELDRPYHIAELAKTNGKLVLYIESDRVTDEKAAEILLTTKRLCDGAGVTFYSVDFVLQYPKTEAGSPNGESIDCKEFLYSDIYEEGLEERVRISDEATKAHYAELDKEKQE